MKGVKKVKPKYKNRLKLSSVQLARKKMNQSKASIYGRKLVSNPTPAEKVMIELLEESNIIFDFQKQFYDLNHCYIVDFYLRRDNGPLVIEIDGKNHEHSKEYDQRRTEWLKKRRHCEVVRYSNSQVINEPENVIIDVLMRNVRIAKQE